MTFLLNVIESGEVQVPLPNVIVAVELLNTTPRRLKVLPINKYRVKVLRAATKFIVSISINLQQLYY